MLFQNRRRPEWGQIASMYVGNLVPPVLNLPVVGLFALIFYIPPGIILVLILGITAAGVYSFSADPVDSLLRCCSEWSAKATRMEEASYSATRANAGFGGMTDTRRRTTGDVVTAPGTKSLTDGASSAPLPGGPVTTPGRHHERSATVIAGRGQAEADNARLLAKSPEVRLELSGCV